MDRTRHAAVASARRTATPRSSRARVLASARPLVRSSSRTGVQLRRKSVVGVRRRGAGEECEAQNGLQTLIVASLRLSVAPAPLAEFAVESRRADPQQLGGTFAIAADLSQGAENRTQFFAAPRLRQARNPADALRVEIRNEESRRPPRSDLPAASGRVRCAGGRPWRSRSLARLLRKASDFIQVLV